jgi:cytochrome P450
MTFLRRTEMTITDTPFFSPGYWDDALRIGDLWRDETPVCQATLPDGLPVWVITRYADARRALDDPRLSKDSGLLQDRIRSCDLPPSGMIAPSALFTDGEVHARLRALLLTAFTRDRTEALRPRFEVMTAELLATLSLGEPVDLMDKVAVPLPLAVICELLGVPVDPVVMAELRGWTMALNENDPETSGNATQALAQFFGELMERKRRDPGDDLVSALVHVSGDQDRLRDDELMGTLFLLLNAGHDTTANLIGNSVRWLLHDRGHGWRKMHEHPEMIPGAIEEGSRLDPPVRMATHRIPTEDVEFSGVTIPKGSIVLICLHSANRDPDQFEAADQFDLGRKNIAHLSFGRKTHSCVGAALGRMEAQIVIRQLTARFPGAELRASGGLQGGRSPIMGGYRRVPVYLGPA